MWFTKKESSTHTTCAKSLDNKGKKYEEVSQLMTNSSLLKKREEFFISNKTFIGGILVFFF